MEQSQEISDTAEKMLTCKEAAELLGYTPSGLYKIIDRTRKGKPGAKIQFFQVGSGPIKFKQDWLDKFVAANSITPDQMTVQLRPMHRQKSVAAHSVQIERHWDIAS